MTKAIGVSLWPFSIASFAQAESIGAVFYIPLGESQLNAASSRLHIRSIAILPRLSSTAW